MSQDTTSPPPSRLDARLRASLVAVALTGATFALMALAFVGLSSAVSVAVGAGLATVNLWTLARIVAALLPDEAGGPTGGTRGASGARPTTVAWALLGIVKMFALFAVVWLLMQHEVVSALPMLVGFGALPIGIAIGSIVSDRGGPRRGLAP
jgi:hypothetical protein